MINKDSCWHALCVRKILFACLFFPVNLYASFIESTMGTAVVNDATATYHNPAALTLLKKRQVIGLGTEAYYRSDFSGQSKQIATGLTQTGTSNTHNHYLLPSFYLGIPASDRIGVGVAVISNAFSSNLEENSILRYVQPSTNIENVDLVPAIGYKLTERFSVGAALNISYASFLMRPISGFPSLNIPDSTSINESSATAWGGDVGVLFKPSNSTLIGFNYLSSVTYKFDGKSTLQGNPETTSNNYHFQFWTPARSVFSISHFLTPQFGMIATLQRIQWDIFNTVNLHNFVTQVGSKPTIVSSSLVQYHLRNAWIMTLGGQYRVTPKWVIRIASTYNQSPSNGAYQISNGNSVIVGASMGYQLTNDLLLDGGYSHAFIQTKNINIATSQNLINGNTQGSLDAVAVKLTLNV